MDACQVVDYAYFGPPLLEKKSPYWPKGVPWNPREAHAVIGHKLDPEQIKNATQGAPGGAIPSQLECACQGKYCLLPIFDSFCIAQEIPRSTAKVSPVVVQRPYFHYVAISAILRHPEAKKRLEDECAPARLREAIKVWGRVPPFYAGVVWKVRDLSSLATAVTVPGSSYFREIVSAIQDPKWLVYPRMEETGIA